MKKLLFILALVLPTTALAAAAAPVVEQAVVLPAFVTDLMTKIPAETIAWVVAVFGLITSLASFLDFLNKKLNKEGQSGFLNKVSHGLSIFLKYTGKVLDVLTANSRPKV